MENGGGGGKIVDPRLVFRFHFSPSAIFRITGSRGGEMETTKYKRKRKKVTDEYSRPTF